MLEKRCVFFREIELVNVLIETLIIKKYEELKNDIQNKKIISEYNELKKMSNNLLDKNIRTKIFNLAGVKWEA